MKAAVVQPAYRSYRPGDEFSLCRLYEETFGRSMSQAQWRWQYLENPAGEAIIEVAECDDRILGQYAVVPRRVHTPEGSALAVLSLDTMLHPDLRGLGVFQDLAECTYDRATRRGARFVYGFPNRTGFLKPLQWAHVTWMPLWRSNGPWPSRGSGRIRVDPVEAFDTSIDALWEQLRPHGVYSLVRDCAYLTWRYVRRPGVAHQRWIASDAAGRPCGWVIGKIFSGDEPSADLMDLAACDANSAHALLAAALSWFQRQGIRVAVCWLSAHHSAVPVLEAWGFRPDKSRRRPLGGRYFEGSAPAAFTDASSWHVTMGDSDLY